MNTKTTKPDFSYATKTEILLIGAGLGGLGATAKLLEAGYKDVIVLEAGDAVGGVWQMTRYPNIACDTPIDLYAYSFYPGDQWSSNFAPGHEIQKYLQTFSDHFGVSPKITFNTRVAQAVWDEEEARYLITATDGRKWIARYLIWAGGIFSQSVTPATKGLNPFMGLSLHSTEWHDGIDLTGKRVAVVGGGATAIQIIPYVQEHAEHLYSFVRTPSYVSPRPEITFSEEERGTPEFIERLLERRKEWFDRFEMIGKARFPMNEKLIAEQEAVWQEVFDKEIKDPHAREVLTPNYRFGCKRPLFSSAYYPAVTQKNVTLIGRGVSHVDGDSIIDVDGERYPIDVIVWATGYNPTKMLNGIDIRGRDGRALADEWDPVPRAFFGAMVKGFPNFFTINGPNSGGPTATDFVEGQIGLIIRSMDAARSQSAKSFEVCSETFDKFNEDIQRRASVSVLALGNCSSYYRVGGDGEIFTHWPDTMAAFAERIVKEGIDGVVFNLSETVS